MQHSAQGRQPVFSRIDAHRLVVNMGTPRLLGLPPGRPGLPLALVIRDPIYMAHYFHLWEIVAGIMPHFRGSEMDEAFPICIGSQKIDGTKAKINTQFLRALFPAARIMRRPLATVSSVILADRHARPSGRLNKLLEWDAALLADTAAAATIRARTLRGLSIVPQRDPRRAIIVQRQPPRAFLPDTRAALERFLAARGYSVDTVDFGALSWRDQVKTAAEAGLIAGVHGNGLTHAAFAAPGSLVVEFMPPGTRHYDYQLLSEISDLRYVGVRADRTWLGGDRSEPAHGTPRTAVSSVPWDELGRRLTDLGA